jgi:hypothetical protein
LSRAATGPPARCRAIENLIAAHAELVDDGDFTHLGALLAEASFTGGGAISGRPECACSCRHAHGYSQHWAAADRGHSCVYAKRLAMVASHAQAAPP